MAQLADVNVHRIIRRSTTYGAPYDPNATSEQDDDVPRGIYFIFISAKAMATMEFLQQEWINNGNFMNLGDERDPNVGLQEDGATFTIPRDAGQAPHPRHPDVQRAARRRVLLHALPVGLEMDRRPLPLQRALTDRAPDILHAGTWAPLSTRADEPGTPPMDGSAPTATLHSD